MLRNWYAVYTKPQKEKIVSLALAKKGFESFCPLINAVKARNNRRYGNEPLFMCHVFVYLCEADLATVKSIPGVINALYWKSRPAIIKVEEIDAIRHFTSNYINIKLVKCAVNNNESIRFREDPVMSFNEKTVLVNYQTIKVNLPSLGYTMIADRKGAEEEEAVYHEASLLRNFPRKLNSFFFN